MVLRIIKPLLTMWLYIKSRLDFRFLFNSDHRSFKRTLEANHAAYTLQEEALRRKSYV